MLAQSARALCSVGPYNTGADGLDRRARRASKRKQPRCEAGPFLQSVIEGSLDFFARRADPAATYSRTP